MSAAMWRKYATAGQHVYIPMIKRAAVDFALAADWVPAAGDVRISIDGAASANIGTLPTAITMGNTAMWDFVFTAGELTGKKILVTIADAATKTVEDQMFFIETYGNAAAEYPVDFSAAQLPVQALSLGTTAQTDVKNQVVAAINTDTYPEPGQGLPGANISLVAKISYLYKAFRNRITQTSTTMIVYANDGTTADHKSAVSDDGTTFTRGPVVSGP